MASSAVWCGGGWRLSTRATAGHEGGREAGAVCLFCLYPKPPAVEGRHALRLGVFICWLQRLSAAC